MAEECAGWLKSLADQYSMIMETLNQSWQHELHNRCKIQQKSDPILALRCLVVKYLRGWKNTRKFGVCSPCSMAQEVAFYLL